MTNKWIALGWDGSVSKSTDTLEVNYEWLRANGCNENDIVDVEVVRGDLVASSRIVLECCTQIGY